MNSIQKVLTIIFDLLIIVTLGELILYFYYQPQKNTKSTMSNPSLVPSQSGQTYLLNLIPKAKTQTGGDDGIALIKTVDYHKNCFVSSDCFEIDNKDSNWYGTDSTPFLPISSPFVIHLSLKTRGDASGVSFSGSIFTPGGFWWQDLKSIFFGVGKEGSHMRIEARNGTTEGGWTLFDKDLPKAHTYFNILFDQQGKNMLILDEQYDPIIYLDINKLTDNVFPDGVFSEKKLYFSTSIAPKSYLAILEFQISPLQ